MNFMEEGRIFIIISNKEGSVPLEEVFFLFLQGEIGPRLQTVGGFGANPLDAHPFRAGCPQDGSRVISECIQQARERHGADTAQTVQDEQGLARGKFWFRHTC